MGYQHMNLRGGWDTIQLIKGLIRCKRNHKQNVGEENNKIFICDPVAFKTYLVSMSYYTGTS